MPCNIREWRIEDAPQLVTAINHKAVTGNLRDGIAFPYTQRDAEEYISHALNADKNAEFLFAITLCDKAIGSIGAYRKENIHSRTAELGYYIAPEHWGNGYATQAVKLICEWIFEHTDIIRIFAEPFTRNKASCRVLEKAGFLREGVLIKNAVKNGETLDMSMYALIRPSIPASEAYQKPLSEDLF